MITTAGLFLRLEQTLRRSRFRNFVKSRQRLESQRRRKWAKRFKRHKTLDQIDLLAFFQRHDRFLPMRFATEVGAALPFLFAGVIAGVHVHHLLLKEFLDCLLNLNLVSSRPDTKDILVLLLAQERRLFRQRRCFDDVERLVHSCPGADLPEAEVLSANFARAPSVTKIFSKASNCSVFTSLAVASFTGLTLRADL